MSRDEVAWDNVRVGEWYDTHAEKCTYSMLFPGRLRNQVKRVRRLLELMQPKPGERILEVGTGVGTEAKIMLDSVDIDLVGIDLSWTLLKKALACVGRTETDGECRPCFSAIVADGEVMPFFGEVFDHSFSFGALHHTCSPSLLVREMTRVVRPGGRVLVLEPNVLDAVSFLTALGRPAERGVLRMRRADVMKWFREAGLVDVALEHFLYAPPLSGVLGLASDIADCVFGAVPLLRCLSVNLICSGTRKR